MPNDFDACREEAGVDPTVLDPFLQTFDPDKVTQEAKYLAGLFPQADNETGGRKGIIAIDLGDLR